MSDQLRTLRAQLTQVDDAIVDHLAKRMSICREVAKVKVAHDIAMMQPGRVDLVLERSSSRGAEQGLDAGFVRDLYEKIIGEACRIQDELMEPGRAARP
jgi:4-amino-4-deoxychorismate mutase